MEEGNEGGGGRGEERERKGEGGKEMGENHSLKADKGR